MHRHRVYAALTASALLVTPLSVALQAAPALAASGKRVYGPWVPMHWGPVRVSIFVRGKKITGVSASYPTERPRSQRINTQAVPILRSEVLKAQSARIYGVSGATLTSEAYDASLAAAIRKAHV